MRQVKIYLQCVFLSSPVLANIHSIVTYDVPRIVDVDPPTQFRLNVGPAWQPIAGSMPVNHLASSTLIHHWVCCILCTNTWHSPNAVSMLTHSLWRWPNIETVLGGFTVFFWLLHCYAVTLSIPMPEIPDNMMHWPNVDAMLGHRLRRWANIIPTETL